MGSVAKRLREDDGNGGDRHLKRGAPRRKLDHVSRVASPGIDTARTCVADIKVAEKIEGQGHRVVQQSSRGIDHRRRETGGGRDLDHLAQVEVSNEQVAGSIESNRARRLDGDGSGGNAV